MFNFLRPQAPQTDSTIPDLDENYEIEEIQFPNNTVSSRTKQAVDRALSTKEVDCDTRLQRLETRLLYESEDTDLTEEARNQRRIDAIYVSGVLETPTPKLVNINNINRKYFA
jgi:hypothetical protein